MEFESGLTSEMSPEETNPNEQLMVNFNLVGSVLPKLEQDNETFISKIQT